MQAHEPLIHHQFRTILVPGHQDKALAEHREIVTCIKQINGNVFLRVPVYAGVTEQGALEEPHDSIMYYLRARRTSGRRWDAPALDQRNGAVACRTLDEPDLAETWSAGRPARVNNTILSSSGPLTMCRPSRRCPRTARHGGRGVGYALTRHRRYDTIAALINQGMVRTILTTPGNMP